MQANQYLKGDPFIQPKISNLQAQKQKLKCPYKIQSYSVCVSPQCSKPGLMCIDSACRCRDAHQICHHSPISRVLKIIDNHRKQISTQEIRNSYKAVNQLIKQMIDKLTDIKKKLYIEQRSFGFSKQELEFIALIEEQKIDSICGKIVSELEKTFDVDASFIICDHKDIMKDFEKKREEFDSLCRYIENNYMKYDANKNKKIFWNSKIIDQKQKQTILKWLSETQNKKKFESRLLFRASEHKFKAVEFHKHCDGIQNTLVIVKTEFDKIIGGFTPNKWRSPIQFEYVNDKSGKAFLFSLNLGQKYKCTDLTKSITCQQFSGPKFGWNDLQLSDNAHINNNSVGKFPDSYNFQVKGMNQYQKNQKTRALFTGDPEGCFKVKQYEVYQIKAI